MFIIIPLLLLRMALASSFGISTRLAETSQFSNVASLGSMLSLLSKTIIIVRCGINEEEDRHRAKNVSKSQWLQDWNHFSKIINNKMTSAG